MLITNTLFFYLIGLMGSLLSLNLLANPIKTCPAPIPIRASATQENTLKKLTEVINTNPAQAQITIEAHVRKGELERELGRNDQAVTDFTAARDAAKHNNFSILEATALLGLGQTRIQQRQLQAGEALLRNALALAEQNVAPTIAAASANALALILQEQHQENAARELWQSALQQARQADDPGLEIVILLNLAHFKTHKIDLNAMFNLARQVKDPIEQVSLRLRIAAQMTDRINQNNYKIIEDNLQLARTAAAEQGLSREYAQITGQLGLLKTRSQPATARILFEQALRDAPIDAYDLRYRWEWELGRVWRTQGDRTRAISAYRRSVSYLQHIRFELPIEYSEGRSSFRETLEPLYLELADLLLREAGAQGAAVDQAILREARDTIEQLKLDELRDYFRDACILPLRKEIGILAARTAVLYPVIFADRLELLLSIEEKLYQTTVPINREQVRITAQMLALKLRYGKPAQDESNRLYDWLISPIQTWLTEHKVDTLVYVPDGPLRTVPLSALNKNGKYLIDDYAIATTTGLKLLAPEGITHTKLESLVAGLSRPGPVVDVLPRWWVNAMVQQHRRALHRQVGEDDRGLRGISVSTRGAQTISSEQFTTTQSERIEALSLPGVAEEVNQLSKKLPGRILRDQEFMLNRFVNEVGEQSYRVVHIASHGLFQGPPEENFVVTYDRKLDMQTLANTLKPKELAQQPIEILVLSACQTAEGDDRTPLGLSGVALQSGARSALGSLWPVSDQATQLLMRNFYERLQIPGMTKGHALQEAQKALIATQQFQQPTDWAAFILIGNWL